MAKMASNASQLRHSFRDFLAQEGASSHFGLFWITPKGEKIMVNDISGSTKMSHEEWANKHGYTLEELLEAGWVRLQAINGNYLIADHQSRRGLNSRQHAILFSMMIDNPSKYPQIAIETPHGMKQFRDTPEEREEALEYLCAA